MTIRTALLGTAIALGLAQSPAASAATLTDSLTAWTAAVTGGMVTSTGATGNDGDNGVTSIALADGSTLAVSPADNYQANFDWTNWGNGFGGNVFSPSGAATSGTITLPSGISAFGFWAQPGDTCIAGIPCLIATPFTITVSVGGQSITDSVGTTSQFFGISGGIAGPITISTNDVAGASLGGFHDPINPTDVAAGGLAYGQFLDVPEPASVALLAAGLGLLGLARRRR